MSWFSWPTFVRGLAVGGIMIVVGDESVWRLVAAFALVAVIVFCTTLLVGGRGVLREGRE